MEAILYQQSQVSGYSRVAATTWNNVIAGFARGVLKLKCLADSNGDVVLADEAKQNCVPFEAYRAEFETSEGLKFFCERHSDANFVRAS